jgi:YegS/Rv2252/BmrU family lipid kinase
MEKINNEKWVFIVNPIAGNNYAETLIPKISDEIKKHAIDAVIETTEYHGHATKIAMAHVENGTKYIVSVGGDGTLNEIAKALLGKPDHVLGVIPAGTGNDFIQILGFPNRFDETHWEVFFQKNITLMDAGSCNNIPFFNGMGLGFDAEVAAQNYSPDGEVKKGGKGKYWWHIIKTLLFYREHRMTIVNNGSSKKVNCFINTISNGRRFAGDFFLTPKAIANDGLLDVCAIEKLNLFERFSILLKVPKGEHLNVKKVKYFNSDKLKLEFEREVPFHVDGELFFASYFEVNIIKGAINVIFNPNGDHFFTFS